MGESFFGRKIESLKQTNILKNDTSSPLIGYKTGRAHQKTLNSSLFVCLVLSFPPPKTEKFAMHCNELLMYVLKCWLYKSGYDEKTTTIDTIFIASVSFRYVENFIAFHKEPTVFTHCAPFLFEVLYEAK